MTNEEFMDKLLYGQEAEIAVSRWLMQRGYYVVPRYIPNGDGDNAPSMFGLAASYVLPDLDVFAAGKRRRFWFEVKRKRAYTWDGCKQTGFSPRLREHYLRVQQESGNEVFVGFYDEGESLLYGNFLSELEQKRVIGNEEYPRFFDGCVNGVRKEKPIVFYPLTAMVTLSDIPSISKVSKVIA